VWLAAAGAVAAAASLLGGHAWASTDRPADAHAATWTAPAGADYQQQVHAYWTPERIRSAVPDEAPRLSAAADRPSVPVAVGEPGHVDGAPPAGGTARRDAVTPAVDGDGRAARWVDPGDPRFNESPASTTGVLLFTRSGRNYMCSGSVVNSEAKNMVITAGHCLYKDGLYSGRVVFIPDFYKGSTPYSLWTAVVMAPSHQWVDRQDFHYDWAFMLVIHDASGRRLADVTGSQGIYWNYPDPLYRLTWIFGYPAEPPYDGQMLWYCHEYAWNDGLNRRNIGMMCNMNGGASGGPWIMGDTPAYAWVNGVTSYTYGNNALYSSYFGSDVAQQYQALRRWNT
jgi:V8-like Glu-specific endopeptidase